MERKLFQELLAWKDRPGRMPLLLRGARQVGKTYLVEQLADRYFQDFHSINFELEPEYEQCFESLDPQKIVMSIAGLSGQQIIAGKSLLFLDEIQNCPRAIMALRYFKEKMPELHVIGAGSLLEFTLRSDDFSMPVGRVEYLYLKPLSFREFLKATQHDVLCEAMTTCTIEKPISPAFHEKLLTLARDYTLVGGMPAAVSQYLISHDYAMAHHQQTVILSTYRDDFGKYAKTSDHKYLQKVFSQAPAIAGQQIQYSKIDPEFRSRDLKRAIHELSYAGVISTVYSTAASGLPLSALINEKKFKLLFLDIGLMNRTMRLTVNDLQNKDIIVVNRGAVAEQWVGQELLAYADPKEASEIHYWSRDKRGSKAEVDYVIAIDGSIIPIEVKAGVTGNLKSLHLLMKERGLDLGIRISQQPLGKNKNIVSIPLYLISELKRLISQA